MHNLPIVEMYTSKSIIKKKKETTKDEYRNSRRIDNFLLFWTRVKMMSGSVGSTPVVDLYSELAERVFKTVSTFFGTQMGIKTAVLF